MFTRGEFEGNEGEYKRRVRELEIDIAEESIPMVEPDRDLAPTIHDVGDGHKLIDYDGKPFLISPQQSGQQVLSPEAQRRNAIEDMLSKQRFETRNNMMKELAGARQTALNRELETDEEGKRKYTAEQIQKLYEADEAAILNRYRAYGDIFEAPQGGQTPTAGVGQLMPVPAGSSGGPAPYDPPPAQLPATYSTPSGPVHMSGSGIVMPSHQPESIQDASSRFMRELEEVRQANVPVAKKLRQASKMLTDSPHVQQLYNAVGPYSQYLDANVKELQGLMQEQAEHMERGGNPFALSHPEKVERIEWLRRVLSDKSGRLFFETNGIQLSPTNQRSLREGRPLMR